MSFYMPASSSGLKVASANIVPHEAKVTGVTLIPAGAAATVILYNNAATDAVSGQELVKLAAVANGESVQISFDHPIHANLGIYAAVSGTGAAYIVHYTH